MKVFCLFNNKVLVIRTPINRLFSFRRLGVVNRATQSRRCNPLRICRIHSSNTSNDGNGQESFVDLRQRKQQLPPPQAPPPVVTILQFPATMAKEIGSHGVAGIGDGSSNIICYTSRSTEEKQAELKRNHRWSSNWNRVVGGHSPSSHGVLPHDETIRTRTTETKTIAEFWHHHVVRHFLPAEYPTSVAPEYIRFTLAGFAASVAGSAGLVLSTQCLLLAVGVVGTNSQTASIMAGALNWVIKDGIGQLGGVIFASRMGETKRFDANPKRWRTVSALCLDFAALTEIVAPLVLGSLVLPLACGANVLKNIGYLTASASRAALHQSLAVASNLADVTAKAGSQSMAAGLLGTGLGISLSMILGHDATQFATAFGGLVVIHQGCTYLSLTSVCLRHFNKHRLYLLLQTFVDRNVVLSPSEVAEQEVFFPLGEEDDTNEWLAIGSDVVQVCPGGVSELQEHRLVQGQAYLLNASTTIDGKVHLTFFQRATGEDLIHGMLHAVLLRQQQQQQQQEQVSVTLEMEGRAGRDALEKLSVLLTQLKEKGWSTRIDDTRIEPSGAVRIAIS